MNLEDAEENLENSIEIAIKPPSESFGLMRDSIHEFFQSDREQLMIINSRKIYGSDGRIDWEKTEKWRMEDVDCDNYRLNPKSHKVQKIPKHELESGNKVYSSVLERIEEEARAFQNPNYGLKNSLRLSFLFGKYMKDR